MSMHYLGIHEPQKLGFFSHAVYRKRPYFDLLYLQHLSTNFSNFWQAVAMEFVLL